MDDTPDPISQFFPDVNPEDVDLYAVLNLTSSAKSEEIKKAYRKLALIYHPDKHAQNADDDAKAAATLKFQQVGFAYAVLGDEKRREKYDKTGRTDEGFDLGVGEGGWEAYFEDMFERVTKDKLDELKKEYQGSAEEKEDLKQAYVDCDGDINSIMEHIPHSTIDDEPRFIKFLSAAIKKGDLPTNANWDKSVKDEKARLVRKKQADKEAKEAEELAKELGVHDEFFGSGKPSSSRKGKGKAKGKAKGGDDEDDEEDTAALQALILKKRKNMDSFFDGLAAKYASAEPANGKSNGKGKGKGKKRGKPAEDEEEADEDANPSPKKRSRKAAPEPEPDIDDEEFERLQQKLFGDKGKGSKPSSAKGSKPPSTKGSKPPSTRGKKSAVVEEEQEEAEESPKKRVTRGKKAKTA